MKLGGTLALAAALALTGCAPAQPSVPESVASAYAQGTALPAPRQQLPNVVFLGDSFTSGSTMDDGIQYLDHIASTNGWNGVNLGEGSSGYSKKGTRDTSITDRLAEAIAMKPAMVVLAGGFNDPIDALPSAAAGAVARLKAELPGVPVVMLSNFVSAKEPSNVQIRKRDALAAVARDAGVPFIDVTGVFQGHPELIGADNLHPTAEGHKHLADALAPQLPALPAKP